jgi:hypothetical protein
MNCSFIFHPFALPSSFAKSPLSLDPSAPDYRVFITSSIRRRFVCIIKTLGGLPEITQKAPVLANKPPTLRFIWERLKNLSLSSGEAG